MQTWRRFWVTFNTDSLPSTHSYCYTQMKEGQNGIWSKSAKTVLEGYRNFVIVWVVILEEIPAMS